MARMTEDQASLLTMGPLLAAITKRPADEGCVEVQAEVSYALTPLPVAAKPVARKIERARADCDAMAKLCGWN